MPEGTMKALWYNKVSLTALRDKSKLILGTITASRFRYQTGTHPKDQR
jgi:hypothetical protein